MSKWLQKLKNFPTGLLILMIGAALGISNEVSRFHGSNLAESQPVPEGIQKLILTLYPFQTDEPVVDVKAGVAIGDMRTFQLDPRSCPRKISILVREGWFPLLAFETYKTRNQDRLEPVVFWNWLHAKTEISAQQVWSAMTDEALAYYQSIEQKIRKSCKESQLEFVDLQRRRDSNCFFNDNIFYGFLMRSIYPKLVLRGSELRRVLSENAQYVKWQQGNKIRTFKPHGIPRASCGWIPDASIVAELCMSVESAAAVESGSPEWLVRVLSDFRSGLVGELETFFARAAWRWPAVITGFIAVLAYFLYSIFSHDFSAAMIRPESRFLIAFPSFALGSLIGLVIAYPFSGTRALVILAVSQIFSAAVCGVIYEADLIEIPLFIGFIGLFIGLGVLFYKLQRKIRWTSNTVFLLLFVISCLLMNLQFFEFHLNRERSYLRIYVAFRWMMVMGFPAFAAGVFGSAALDRQFLNYILYPMAWIYPLPTRMHCWERKPDWRVVSRGLLDLFTGLIFLGLVFGHRYLVTEVPAFKTNSGFLSYGFVSYLYFYFRSAAIITIPAAVARMAGYGLPDPYNFPLLANTPQERWRRWNTYFYDFFLVSTFHPIFKYTGSVFLGVFAVFYLTALTHTSTNQLFSLSGEGRNVFGVETLWFFLIHGCFVYFGLKTERFWPSMSRRWGWCGVAVTTLLMSSIHFLKIKN